ncbi:MAG: PhzF family phenazine biosynthesis protein [Anderseniella sp.]
MKYQFHTLDVFTTEVFTGNPLAVVLEAQSLGTEQMQKIAKEFNLSETVFVLPPVDGANTAKLRIFTPDRELAFAGHPTVGSAVLLADLFGIDDEVRFEEGVGLVRVALSQRDKGRFAQLAAAVMPEPWTNVPSDKKIAAAMSLKEQQIGYGTHRASVFNPGNHPILYVPLKDREALAEARISMNDWSALGAAGAFLAYLYCEGSKATGVDFHARAYTPLTGIFEDPATGSAAAGFPGPLLSYEGPWVGTRKWILMQGEDMGRPSRIELEADVTKASLSGIRVGGHAVRVSSGVIEV